MALSWNDAAQKAARELGWSKTFGDSVQDEWKQWKSTGDNASNLKSLTQKYFDAGDAPGAVPTTVASQNDYQKSALYDMGQAPKAVDPRASQAYDRASQGFDARSMQQFINPHLDEVINRNAANITRQYDVNRNRINEDFAAAGGFGSSAQGVERALTNEAEARQIGDMDAQLRSQGFNTAMTNALGLYNNDINKNLAIASGVQGLDSYGRNVERQGLQDRLYAGDRVQAQNQAVLDAYYNERDRELAYPYQQQDYLRGVLGSFPTGQTQTSTSTGNTPGMMQGAIGGALLGNSLYSNIGGNFGVGRDLNTAFANNPSIF